MMALLKRKRLWAWGLAIITLLLLAITLSQLELTYGLAGPIHINLPFSKTTDTAPATGGKELDYQGLDFWDVLYRIVLWVLLPIAILYYTISAFVSSEGRAQALAIVIVLLFFLMLGLIMQAVQQEATIPTPTPVPAEEGFALPVTPLPERETVATQSPEWLVWAIAAALALFLIAVGGTLFRRLRRPAPPTLEQISQQAQETLAEVRTGTVDLKDAVTRCYLQMSEALREQRNMKRPESMTPREFEHRLVEAGLPKGDVRRLTRLFEKVRYGAWVPGLVEEREAVSCLSAIVRACGEAG
jgi:hypothetical protein